MAKIGPEFMPRSDRESEHFRRAHDAFAEAVEHHGTPEEVERAWLDYERVLEATPLEYGEKGKLLDLDRELIQEAEKLTREAQARGINLSPSDFLEKWEAVLSAEGTDAGDPEDSKNDRPLTKEEADAVKDSVEDEFEAEAEKLTKERHEKKEN